MRPKGEYEWECDSQCAINRTDVLLKFEQRWRQPYNADIISNLTQRLGQNRSMTIKSTWVKAYQDEKRYQVKYSPTLLCRISIKVDSIANDYLLDTCQPQTLENAVHVDAQAISICIQGTRITGQYKDAICESIDGSYLRHYPFEYDRAGTVLALARQYSRRHVRKALRGECFHVLESSQVLIPSACLKTTLFTFSEYNRLLFIH
jgi:hypothetical protein